MKLNKTEKKLLNYILIIGFITVLALVYLFKIDLQKIIVDAILLGMLIKLLMNDAEELGRKIIEIISSFR